MKRKEIFTKETEKENLYSLKFPRGRKDTDTIEVTTIAVNFTKYIFISCFRKSNKI